MLVGFRSSVSLGVNCNTSLILIPPRAISSSINRFVGFGGTKDYFIHHFFFENGPAGESRGSIGLFQDGGVTRASEIVIEILSDEIEERGELRVPGPFGCLFGVLIDLGEER